MDKLLTEDMKLTLLHWASAFLAALVAMLVLIIYTKAVYESGVIEGRLEGRDSFKIEQWDKEHATSK